MVLDHNQFSTLPDNIISHVKRSFPALRTLNLSHNNLINLPPAFSSLVSLTDLDVSHNKIKSWPVSLSKLEQLAVLNFSHNGLEWIGGDSGIHLLTRVTTLILARNKYVVCLFVTLLT